MQVFILWHTKLAWIQITWGTCWWIRCEVYILYVKDTRHFIDGNLNFHRCYSWEKALTCFYLFLPGQRKFWHLQNNNIDLNIRRPQVNSSNTDCRCITIPVLNFNRYTLVVSNSCHTNMPLLTEKRSAIRNHCKQ